jgi:hypothetical protein
MDPAALTALVMSILTPFISLVGTTIVSKGSEDVYGKTKEQAKHLYEAIRNRFSHEKDGGNASQALQTFVDGDTDYQVLVEKKLFKLLQDDPAFVVKLNQIIQSGPHQVLTAAEELKASHIRMNNWLGIGHQEINAGRNSTIDDVQFNIGNEKP